MARTSRLQPSIDHTGDSHPESESRRWERDDDEAEIRFSLTALGEAVVSERDRRRRPRFRGFGPCGHVVA